MRNIIYLYIYHNWMRFCGIHLLDGYMHSPVQKSARRADEKVVYLLLLGILLVRFIFVHSITIIRSNTTDYPTIDLSKVVDSGWTDGSKNVKEIESASETNLYTKRRGFNEFNLINYRIIMCWREIWSWNLAGKWVCC